MQSLYESRLLDLEALVAPLPRGNDSFRTMAEAFGRAVVGYLHAQPAAAASSALTAAAFSKADEYGFFDRHGGWQPEFGIVLERAMREDALSGSAQLAIMFHCRGVPGTWDVDFKSPEWFLAGTELIRVQGRVIAGTRHGQNFLRFSDGTRKSERLFPVQVPTAAGDTAKTDQSATRYSALKLMSPEGAEGVGVWPMEDFPLRPVTSRAGVGDTMAATFDILDRFAPEYAPWVRRGIKILMPILGGVNTGYSGSVLERPGWVAASFPVRPELLGEALVHEAAHQHFYLGAFSTPYCEQSFDATYFSPIRQADRPLWAVLMAYHAVVNMVLYYVRLLESGFDPSSVCSRRYEYWSEIAQKYENSFERANMPLTEAGLTLLKALYAKTAGARAVFTSA